MLYTVDGTRCGAVSKPFAERDTDTQTSLRTETSLSMETRVTKRQHQSVLRNLLSCLSRRAREDWQDKKKLSQFQV